MLIEYLSEILNTEYAQINFVVCSFLTYPIAYLNHYIENEILRLIYGFITGLIIQYQMFGRDIIHLVISTLITYFFIKYFGRKLSAFYVLIINISHLSFLHLERVLYHYGEWSLGIETLYMMSICKFSSVAFNYEDGGKDENDIKSSYHKSKKLTNKPSLLELFSFVFFYPSCLIGPSYEFIDFLKYIKREEEFKNLSVLSCVKASAKEFLLAFINMFLLVKLNPIYDINYVSTEEYDRENIFYKIFYYFMLMNVLRFKYYSGWKLSQGCLNLCGLSYQKTDKEENFNRIECASILKIEKPINPRIKLSYWNRTVHLWLKYYVFLRLNKNKTTASFYTFAISALWHGFYPNYYIFFLQFFMVEYISTKLEDMGLFDKIEKSNWFIYIISWILSMTLYSCLAVNFAILNLKKIYLFNKSFYFIQLIILKILFITLLFARKKKKTL